MSDGPELINAKDLYDYSGLIERLTNGVARSNRSVVFLVGTALTAPTDLNSPGVPGVAGVVDLIRGEFDIAQRNLLDVTLASSANQYQEAFRFLLGRRGQEAANSIIRRAVSEARIRLPVLDGGNPDYLGSSTDDETCRRYDNDVAGWHLSPGVEALGRLASKYPARFGRTVLTTNFDPLIGTSISAAGGSSFRTVLHRDGNLGQSGGNGSHIVHLHGYWYGSDTLHTPRQLNQPRPQLKASLAQLIRSKILVVLGYGGWDDVFTDALMSVVLEDNAYPEILWTFHEEQPKVPASLLQRLTPGIDRGRVSLYKGVDCHRLLPEVLHCWQKLESLSTPDSPALFELPTTTIEPRAANRRWPAILTGDQPPLIDFYVGREDDLSVFETADFKVGFVTGIGGQGKSALAARYLNNSLEDKRFDCCVWKDCREEANRFENHLVSIIRAFDKRSFDGFDVTQVSLREMAALFVAQTAEARVLAVFDNVDHYVDLETGNLSGSAGEFVDYFLSSKSKSQILLTCRPAVRASPERGVISQRLEGIDVDAAIKLFAFRKADVNKAEVERAHELTRGHAFWLDLLAAQLAKRAPNITLGELLETGSDTEIPDSTLRSIWNSLRDREKIVLQAVAETLRPCTSLELSNYLGSKLRFNQMSRAIRYLRDLSLIVIKRGDGAETFELHPLIKAFIKKTFPRSERLWFIEAILKVYNSFIVVHRERVLRSPAPETTRFWLEQAELCVNAGRSEQAFETLAEIRKSVLRSESKIDFLRVVDLLFSNFQMKSLAKSRHFDTIFSDYSRLLSNFGRIEAASNALESYKETISGKDSRYINLCDMQCYLHWINHNYPAAISWGLEGSILKKKSGVDTVYSSDHNLALAQRDSGAVDVALNFFLNGATIAEVTDAKIFDKERSGAFYGNIGRCLHLKGEVEPALICYRKSAKLLQGEIEDNLENQAYARQWIGELLTSKADTHLAIAFLRAAQAKWAFASPPKAWRLATATAELLKKSVDLRDLDFETAEAMVHKWIMS